jgi:SAM-dependent methyltransferase
MQFNFGQNWENYSSNALTPERIAQAQNDFKVLIANIGEDIAGKSFLDIGFGQGFSLLSATSMGAHTIGCDISQKCGEVLDRNRIYFPKAAEAEIPLVIGSILDSNIVKKLKYKSAEGNGYDIVHSWGVLHHTGNMELAIRNAASLVKPGGYLIIAIYNRHWSSAGWGVIKWLYCKSPSFIQKMFIIGLYPIIYIAKWWVTLRNPQNQTRGMDFYYNVIDWVGGYPYEYSSQIEIVDYVKSMNFKSLKIVPAEVPTGCNEFIFGHYK